MISVQGSAWTIEEAGDRDPVGARLGAILQALIAREPAERRPSITGWLPDGFLPPQVTIVGESPAKEIMMIKPLTAHGQLTLRLTGAEVCYWRGDAF